MQTLSEEACTPMINLLPMCELSVNNVGKAKPDGRIIVQDLSTLRDLVSSCTAMSKISGSEQRRCLSPKATSPFSTLALTSDNW